MASSSHSKEDILPTISANHQAPGVDLGSLSPASDNDSGTLKESHLGPGERNKMDLHKTAASPTAKDSDLVSSTVAVRPLQPVGGQSHSQRENPETEDEQAQLASMPLEGEPNKSKPSQQKHAHVVEGEANDAKPEDAANTTLPEPSHQPVADHNPNQVISTSTETSSIYSTGLDVDSNRTGPDNDGGDSALGASVYSSTYSTRSSLYDFVEENGRTYHRFKQGKYHLPNDQVEKDRLNLQHYLCCLSFESLYLAPINNLDGGLHNVLDIATGTGIWAIEFADQFPTAVVIGTDLSPIQPEYVPPNLRFEVDDAEDSWTFSHKFDYIHGRMLVTCFQSHLAVFKSAFDFLRPGGYIELQDLSLPFLGIDEKWDGSAFQRWMGLLMDGAKSVGKDWSRVPKYKAYLEEIGFVDVVERKFPCPIGPWAKGTKNKTLGVLGRANILQALEGLSMAILTKGLGMTVEEIELLLIDVRKDINKSGNESIHLYVPTYVVYGRRP